MFNFNRQKNKFQVFLSTFKYKLSVFGKSPHFDWAIAVILGFVLIFVFSLISYFHFIGIEKLLLEDFVSEKASQKYDIVEFEKVIQKFESRISGEILEEELETVSDSDENSDENSSDSSEDSIEDNPIKESE